MNYLIAAAGLGLILLIGGVFFFIIKEEESVAKLTPKQKYEYNCRMKAEHYYETDLTY